MRKIKKKTIILLISILVVILLLVGLYFYGLTSVSSKSEPVTFNVSSGTGVKQVINDLRKSNLIKSKIATTLYVYLHPDLIIQAGSYELDRMLDTKEIFERLNNGDVINNDIRITFIEGKRLIDYIPLITKNFGYSEEEVLNVIKDQDYLESSILNEKLYYSLEGYLFPATYDFSPDAKITDIIEKMLDKTQNVLDNYSTSIKEKKLSNHEVLTIASIIENETMVPEDRSIVSQVIYKRLDSHMSLGMDVTAYYGARKSLSEELNDVDLNSDNAYNTRNTSFIGLPVGPISNPSEASIEAALNPSTTDYVYFYADKNGKLHFAKTNAEVQEIIRTYS